MKGDLSGRIALVTGASRGIGAGIARSLAAQGAGLVLVARSAAPLAALSEEIKRSGGEARTIVADLSSPAGRETVIQEGGAVDILVNNAAVAQRFLRVTDPHEDYWRAVMEVGFWTPVALTQAFGREMVKRGGGVIINISSVGGMRAIPFVAHYCAVKAAADMVMRCAAMELGRHGVRTVSIAPGAIDTQHHGVSDKKATDSPVKRVGLPSDVGELAAFLASDRANFITGAIIACDGGSTAGSFASYDLLEPYVSQPA